MDSTTCFFPSPRRPTATEPASASRWPHHGHVWDFLELAVTDTVVEGLVALVEMRANARRAQPFV